MPLSKPFAVATEGQTIDGRKIDRKWIEDMAKHYDPKAYTANANLEHLVSLAPEGMFSVQGPVVSLSTREAEFFGEKKLQLMAVVNASDTIIAAQKTGKKMFASIEVAQNFLGKGFTYLTGLAFTDQPASIGTESMKFSASKDNIYSFKDEVEIQWEQDEKPAAGDSLFSKVMGLLKGEKKDNESRFTDIGLAVEAIAQSQKDLISKFAATPDKKLSDELAALTKKFTELETAHNAFKAEVEKMSDGKPKRPAATGGKNEVVTDC
jgi:hypothetical protein